MPSFSDPRLVCRPTLRSDTADILQFTKFIWDGDDYIEYVWKDWLDDPDGLLATAQYGPHAVGIAKVTHLSPGQWWLEGLRVNPDFQGLKIGSHLHEYMDRWWITHGDGVIRLMTSSERVQVHHLCQRTGYAKLGEVAAYRLDISAQRGSTQEPSTLALVATNDLGSALDFASAHLAHSAGLMDSGWRFSTPDEANMADRIRQGHLRWWRGRAGLLSTFEDEEQGARILAVGFATTVDLRLLPDLLRDVGTLAQQQGFAAVQWLAPVQAEVQAALQEAGYTTDWMHTGYLYGKAHPGE